MSSAFKRVFLKDVYAEVDGNREEESVVWEGRGEVGDCSHLDTLSPARRTVWGGGAEKVLFTLTDECIMSHRHQNLTIPTSTLITTKYMSFVGFNI